MINMHSKYLTRWICAFFEYTRTHVKIILNSPILRNNHELDSIALNEGQINGELTYFLRTTWNLIESKNELNVEMRDFYIFGKRTPGGNHEIKKSLNLDQDLRENQRGKIR